MLQDIRNNAQGTIAKVIIGLLVIGLSMFGMDAIIGGFSGEPEVATVNGKDITEREFQRTVQMERQRQLSQMENPDPSLINDDELRNSVLEGLIREAVLSQDAVDQGMQLSNTDIDRIITSMSQFQVDGEFSREAFTATVRNAGMGVAEFREALRRQFVINQIRSGIAASAIVNPETAKDILKLQSQTRSFSTLTIPADAVSASVKVTDDEIQDYYDANKADYKVPENVDAAYVALSLDALAKGVEVSDEELKEAYESQSKDLGGEEQRRASHILIEPGDDAEATVAEVEKKLADGEDFAKVAEEYSKDPISAQEGGDLGYAGKGAYAGPFEDALFELKEGETSEPVETRFGFHIIKLTGIRKTERPSFESMKDELREGVAREKAGKLFSEKRTQLADLSYSEPNLDVPAEELGLEIQVVKDVAREGGDAPFDHQGLVRQLFSDDVLNGEFNTEMVDVNNSTAVVARVREHHEEKQLSLAEVSDQIREQLKAEHIQKALTEKGSELVASLQDGADPASVAEEAGAEWQEHPAMSRNGRGVEFDVLQSVFSMPRPEDGKTYDSVAGAQRVVIVGLENVQEGEISGGDEQVKAIANFLTSQRGQREYIAYSASLRDSAEIEKP
ncbi:SurA N-terminal domain-containing protein [Marinobacter sp. V034]|uniref:SurA N-terminal domain-containing protein n=1 Tax=Marinobacter sp. V034 TaxID=3459610 RepID=UPI004043DD67